MQLSLIGICWATIGTVALLYFAHGQRSFTWDIPAGLVVGAIVAGILKATYWK